MSNQSIDVAGTDLGGSTYGVLVIAGPFPAMGEPRVDVQSRGSLHGSTSQGFTMEPLHIPLRCLIIGDAAQSDGDAYKDKFRKLDAVKTVLDPNLGEQFISIDRENDALPSDLQRGYYARVERTIIAEPKGRNAIEFNLDLVVPEGVARGLADVTQNDTIATDPDSFTTPTAAVLGGTNPVRPVFVLVNTDSTTITSLTLANATRSETLNLDITLAQNNQCRIDSDRETIEKSTDGGSTWANALSGLTAGDPFPRLTDGSQDTITVTGFVAGTLATTWRLEFL